MAQRRAHGEGTIHRRPDGRWAAQITVGYDTRAVVGKDGTETTRRVQKRRTVYGKTRKEVVEKLNDLQSEIRRGMDTDPNRITVSAYLARWMRDAVAPTVRPVTAVSYQRTIDAHTGPIAHLRLQELKPMHLQQLYSDRLAAGKSKRTVQYLHSILHRALDRAVKWQLLARNPADAVEAPRPDRREVQAVTTDDVWRVLGAFEGSRLYPLVYTAVMTGCRRGELLALRWSDIDMTRGAISINRTLEELSATQVVFTEPKTARSRRSIPVSADVIAVLQKHQVRLAKEKLEAGELYEDNGLVFPTERGRPYMPQKVTAMFRLILQQAGVKRIRLHDLRHAHATLLLTAGTNLKVVSERLGHSTIQITGDIYSHVLPTLQESATRKLGAMMAKNRPASKGKQ